VDQHVALDEARAEKLRSAYRSLVDGRVAAFEGHVSKLEAILAADVAFCEAFAVKMTEVAAKVDARKKLSADVMAKLREIGEEESAGAEVRINQNLIISPSFLFFLIFFPFV
jgi:hypothetical protein